MLNYSSTHLNGATIDMHMPYALFQYCISCILEIANHHAFTCESSRPKWDQHRSTPLTQCGVVQVFGAFHLQAQASCKAPLGRGTCGTKENNHDAKGPKGAIQPGQDPVNGSRQHPSAVILQTGGKTGCRTLLQVLKQSFVPSDLQ